MSCAVVVLALFGPLLLGLVAWWVTGSIWAFFGVVFLFETLLLSGTRRP